VSLGVEVERPNPTPVRGPIVGIDRGILHLAVCSDGTILQSPKALKRGLCKLQRLSKEVSRKKRGSRNRNRAVNRLARHHRRIRNQRVDAMHKATTSLAKIKLMIVVEDLYIAGMLRNHHLARAIADQGWAEFRRQLAYKTVWYGSRLLIADRFFPSSKTCSICGTVVASMPLRQRRFICAMCGLVIDRDMNAARNLARLAEQVAGSSPETENACGEGSAGRANDRFGAPALRETGTDDPPSGRPVNGVEARLAPSSSLG
jgi:putative transposase